MSSRAERQVQAAQRRARAVQLRLAGASFEQIGRQLGVTAARAHQLYTDALRRTVKEPADQLRALELQRLDQLQLAAGQVLRARHQVIQGGKVVVDEHGRPYTDHAPTLNAIRALLAVQERRARLLGLDAPARHAVTAGVTLRDATVEDLDVTITQLEAELARRGPATPPAAETIAPAPDPEAIAAAVEVALDAAGVPLDRREAAYQAVERQLRERGR